MKICSFCNKSEDEVRIMITSKNADICNECILVCMEILIDGVRGTLEFNKENNKVE